MPGLAGVLSLTGALDGDVVTSHLEAMGRAQAHRAPRGWCTTRHPRLVSITANRRQDTAPGAADATNATRANGDDALCLAFCGMLGNRNAVRAELEREGERLDRRDDRECVLRAWQRWGMEAAHHLDGRFVFALHDAKSGRSLLVRDRFGHVPIYYAVVGDRLYFATEVKPILAVLPTPPAPDELALMEWSLYGDVLAPRTLFRGVHALPSGHQLEIAADGRVGAPRLYYDPADVVDRHLYTAHGSRSDTEMMDLVESTAENAIRSHMDGRSDVAIMLSGGVDSTVIAALAARHAPVRAYNFSIANNALLDERPMAHVVAEQLGLDLESVAVTGETYRRELAETTYHYEMPLWHMQAVPLRMLAKRAAQDGTGLLLSGVSVGPLLGAAGDRYRWIFPPAVLDRVPGSAFRVARKAIYAASGLPVVNPFFALNLGVGVQLVDGGARTAMIHRHDRAYGFLDDRDERRMHVMRMTDNALFLRRFFHQGDRVCMAASVEYCDAAVDAGYQELAFNVPTRWMLRKGKSKWVLKELATRYVPREVSFQKKIPLDVPADEYFAPQFRRSLFENGFLEHYLGMPWEIVDMLARTARDRTPTLFRLVHLETWGRLFFLRESVEKVTRLLTRGIVAAGLAFAAVAQLPDQVAAALA